MSAGRAARCLATNWLQTLTTTTFAAHFCTPASSRNMVSRPCSRQIRPPKPPLTVHRPENVVDPVIGAGSGAAGHRNHCKHWHAQGDVALSGLTHHPAKVETP